MRQISRKYARASVNPEVGIGVPAVEADTPPNQRFFCVRSMAVPLWVGRVVASSDAPDPLPGTPTPHGSALSDWRLSGGVNALCRGTRVMATRRILTLNQSRARAAYHRACALASLHSDSSLSVRLARYNHHMQSARVLAQESHCYTAVSGGDV